MSSFPHPAWPWIDPGELRHSVQILQPLESQDSNGELKQTWAIYLTVWAKVDPYGGGEKWADATMAAMNMHKVTMWYKAQPIDTKGNNIPWTKLRLSYNGRVFDIKNVENVLERNILLIMKCWERLYDEAGVRVD
jgi:head-tail adaptor